MNDKEFHNPILRTVELNSEKWFGRFIPESGMNYFLRTEDSSQYGKITFFIFEKKKDIPFAIAKIVRSNEYSLFLKAEYNNLKKITQFKNKGNNIKGFPEPYFFGEINKICFLIESFLSGISLYNYFGKFFLMGSNYEKTNEIIDKVFLWIKEFHLLTAKEV